MKSFHRLALISVFACLATTQASMAFADAGGDGVAIGNVAVSLQIQQQCAISSAGIGVITATAAPVVACDFDQPYQTVLSSDAPDALPLSNAEVVTTAQTGSARTTFWTVVF